MIACKERKNFQKLTAVFLLHTETRQTMLFSATQTKKTEDLARISLKKRPVYVDVEEFEKHSTVSGLQQVMVTVVVKSLEREYR